MAGGFGGMAGALFTCPLDVVKTRLQSDFYGTSVKLDAARKFSNGPLGNISRHVYETISILKNVYQLEGPRSLFKGLGPNLVGVIPARSINFFTYGVGKEFISKHFNEGREESWVHLLQLLMLE